MVRHLQSISPPAAALLGNNRLDKGGKKGKKKEGEKKEKGEKRREKKGKRRERKRASTLNYTVVGSIPRPPDTCPSVPEA